MALLSSVASLVADFDMGPLTVTRRGPATRNAYGEYVQPAAVNVILRPVVVHNLSGRSRDVLPEAIRNKEAIEVYTRNQRLYAGDGYTDVLIYQGRNWVISLAMDYVLQGSVYLSYGTLEDTSP